MMADGGSASRNRANWLRVTALVDNPTNAIRDRHLEHVLCEIDGDRRSIHLGLLSVSLSDASL